MILELLEFIDKYLDAQIWIYYTLIYFQKHNQELKESYLMLKNK